MGVNFLKLYQSPYQIVSLWKEKGAHPGCWTQYWPQQMLATHVPISKYCKKKISRQTPAMRSSLKPQVTLDGLEIHKYSLVLQVRLRQD